MNELDKNVLKDLSNFEVKLDKAELWGAIQTKQRRRAGLGYFSWLLGTGLVILMVYLTIPESLYLKEHNNTYASPTEQLVENEMPAGRNTSTIQESTYNNDLLKSNNNNSAPSINLQLRNSRTVNSIFNNTKPEASLSHLAGQDKFYSTQELLRNNISGGDYYSQNLLNQLVSYQAKTLFATSSNQPVQGVETNLHSTTESNAISDQSSLHNIHHVSIESPALLHNSMLRNSVSSLNDMQTYPTANFDFTKVIMNSPWIFNFDIGYGFTQKTLEAKSNDQSNYLLERIRTEQLKEEILLNAGFSYQFVNGFHLKFGIEGAQWVEEYSNNTETVEDIILDNVPVTDVHHPDGTVQTLIGTGSGTLTTYNQRLLYNQYRSLDVPIMMAYTGTKGRWQYAIEVGLSINAWFGLDGSLLNKAGELVESSSFFKESLCLSAAGSAFIKYRLAQNTSLYMGPSIKKPFQSMDLDSYSITQKMLFHRWRLGVEYRL